MLATCRLLPMFQMRVTACYSDLNISRSSIWPPPRLSWTFVCSVTGVSESNISKLFGSFPQHEVLMVSSPDPYIYIFSKSMQHPLTMMYNIHWLNHIIIYFFCFCFALRPLEFETTVLEGHGTKSQTANRWHKSQKRHSQCHHDISYYGNYYIFKIILLSVIPAMAFCLTFILASYLAFAFNLAYVQTVYISFYLANILTFYLACYFAFYPAYILTSYLTFNLTHVPSFYLAFYLT